MSSLSDKKDMKLTSAELSQILEVNKKAIEIHLEVAQQNEEMLELLTYNKDKITKIDQAMFKLLVILSGLGMGVIFEFVEIILNLKK